MSYSATARLILVGLLLVFSAGAINADQPNQSENSLRSFHTYPYYRFGDCNADGWCNIGDYATMVAFFQGSGIMPCQPANDINGSGTFSSSDVTFLVNWFRGNIPTAPAYECGWAVVPAAVNGQINIENCIGAPSTTAYARVYFQTPLMRGFNFSVAYDNEDIDGITIHSVNPLLSTWDISEVTRDNMPPDNNDTLSTVTFNLDRGFASSELLEFPVLT